MIRACLCRLAHSKIVTTADRLFDAKNLTPAFPFGHGMSYTTFCYSNISVAAEGDAAAVSFTVSNCGPVAGAEVAQLYLRFPDSAGEPPQQLATFEKVRLAPGAAADITLPLTARAFSVWSMATHGWTSVAGRFGIAVGSSSRDHRLFASIDRPAADNAAPASTSAKLDDDLAQAGIQRPVRGSTEPALAVDTVYIPSQNVFVAAVYEAAARERRHQSSLSPLKLDDISPAAPKGTLEFAVPRRVFGSGYSRNYGSVYADAFYTLVADGGKSVLFGVPGVSQPTSVLLTEDGGESWRPWYNGTYVSSRSGYPFIAVRFNSSALHDLGSACASTEATPQSSFHSTSVGTWHKRGGVHHGSEPAVVSFESLPVPLNCTEGGVSADCFWLHAGGTATAVDGGVVLTSAIPWLNGRFGATKENAGIYTWHSVDGMRWTYRGTLATAAQFPNSGEGPNENDLVLLSDGRTLFSVFRIDDGVDGGKVGAKNYRSVRSTDSGRSWSIPREMNDTVGRGMGVARPRMLMLGNGKGPLLLSGGRLYTEHTRDILLWVCWDGMGQDWETYSLSYHHNALVKPALRFSDAVNSTSGRATTSYTSLLSIDSENAAVVYSGETGVFAMRVTVASRHKADGRPKIEVHKSLPLKSDEIATTSRGVVGTVAEPALAVAHDAGGKAQRSSWTTCHRPPRAFASLARRRLGVLLCK